MRKFGKLLMILGALVGGAVGVGILFGLAIPGVSWIVAVGMAKLSLVASGCLMAGGAALQRLANRRDDQPRLPSA